MQRMARRSVAVIASLLLVTAYGSMHVLQSIRSYKPIYDCRQFHVTTRSHEVFDHLEFDRLSMIFFSSPRSRSIHEVCSYFLNQVSCRFA